MLAVRLSIIMMAIPFMYDCGLFFTHIYYKLYIYYYCCPVKSRFRDFSSRNSSKYGT